MTLSISVLGPLVIASDRGRFEKLPKKALAVLALLAAQEGHAVNRERLARLLWDRQSEARHSLRSCLLKLRRGAIRSRPSRQHASCRQIPVIAYCGSCGLRRIGYPGIPSPY